MRYMKVNISDQIVWDPLVEWLMAVSSYIDILDILHNFISLDYLVLLALSEVVRLFWIIDVRRCVYYAFSFNISG